MNPAELINQIKAKLEEIAIREAKNQQEQALTKKRIEQLEREIQQQNYHQSELDNEAIELYRQSEELKLKLDKLQRIVSLSQEFQALQTECQNNQELLQTLYSSISKEGTSQINSVDETQIMPPRQEYPQLTISTIKSSLPNAEELYKQLLSRYRHQYYAFHNSVVDELDLIWWSIAFIVFGRSSYRKLSFKHHPDLEGSEQAMKLINTAWDISQNYLSNKNNPN
jgi:hypothetical protein